MTFETLFGLFYTKYRGEENPPSTTDPEWQIAVRNYNSALDRLESFDDTRWDFLKTFLQDSAQVSPVLDRTLTTGDTSFTAPTDMLNPGGIFWKIDTNGNRLAPLQVRKPEDVGLLSPSTDWGFFTGDQWGGFTFHLGKAVESGENGYGLDYLYYKKLTRLDPDTEDGTSTIAPAPSEYFACYLAGQRFLDSRNFPAYQVMKRDSEEALKQMKLRNNSGDYYNNLGVQDAGPGFGF